MANRCFLTLSPEQVPYPSYRRGFEEESQTLLTSAGCIPLMWIGLFEDGDLRSAELENDDGEMELVTAPVASVDIGLHRLPGVTAFLNGVFGENGSLSYHAELLARYLQSFCGNFVTLEAEEISWLFDSRSTFDSLLREAIGGIRRRDSACVTALLELSTVIPTARFVEYEEKSATDEERWNFFRVMGEPYLRKDVPWGGG
jgi:hypothetical protein